MMKKVLSAILAVMMCTGMTQMSVHAEIEHISPTAHEAFVYGREPVHVMISFTDFAVETNGDVSMYNEQIAQYIAEVGLDAETAVRWGSRAALETYVTREQLQKMQAHTLRVKLTYLDENGEEAPGDWILPMYQHGDVNGDSKINASDAALILIDCAQFGASGTHLLGGGSYFVVPGEQLAAADYNYDGEATAADAAAILIYAAQIGANGINYQDFAE